MSQGEDAAASEASQETGSVFDATHIERNPANQLRYSCSKTLTGREILFYELVQGSFCETQQ